MEEVFDLLVIGSGPGGYVCAIRAAQLGLNVAIVEREHLGGICLNWGCIPTKAILKSAEVFDYCLNAKEFGIDIGKPSANLPKMVERSRAVAKRLSAGVGMLMKKNKIQVFEGEASFISKTSVLVVGGEKESKTITAKHIVIATGARSRNLEGFETDGDLVWNYKHAMVPKRIPKKLIVVGSGAIGIEFASFYNSIGCDVVVLEAASRILMQEDEEVSKVAQKLFEKKGITFFTGISLLGLKKKKGAVELEFKDSKRHLIKANNLLMAVGVVPNSETLMLQNAEVSTVNGRVKVDEECQTTAKSIYAIGDVASTNPCLAHKASHEGVYVAEHVAMKMGAFDKERLHKINYSLIPSCVYSNPQIASIGNTELALKEKGIDFRVGYFRQIANGKALAMGEEDGFTKILVHAKTGEILGAHFIGHEVTELISNIAISMSNELVEESIIATVFPHPSLGEMLHESVLDAAKRVINM